MRKININELIKTIVFMLFGLNLARILINGDIAMYLHPKMFKFIYLASFIFISLGIFSMLQVAKVKNSAINFKALAFIIPLIFFMFKPAALDSEALGNMSFNVLQNNLPKDKIEQEDIKLNAEKKEQSYDANVAKTQVAENATPETTKNTVQIDKEKSEKLGVPVATHSSAQSVDENGNVIETPSLESIEGTMYDSDVFLNALIGAFSKDEKVFDKEFKIVGYVYREDFFEENQFMVGRMLLTCCVVDASPAGIFVVGSGDMREKYPDNTWVEIKGNLVNKTIFSPYENKDIDVIAVDMKSIKKVEPAETPYVYFK